MVADESDGEHTGHPLQSEHPVPIEPVSFHVVAGIDDDQDAKGGVNHQGNEDENDLEEADKGQAVDLFGHGGESFPALQSGSVFCQVKDGKPRQGHDTREGKEFSQEKRAGFGVTPRALGFACFRRFRHRPPRFFDS